MRRWVKTEVDKKERTLRWSIWRSGRLKSIRSWLCRLDSSTFDDSRHPRRPCTLHIQPTLHSDTVYMYNWNTHASRVRVSAVNQLGCRGCRKCLSPSHARRHQDRHIRRRTTHYHCRRNVKYYTTRSLPQIIFTFSPWSSYTHNCHGLYLLLQNCNERLPVKVRHCYITGRRNQGRQAKT